MVNMCGYYVDTETVYTELNGLFTLRWVMKHGINWALWLDQMNLGYTKRTCGFINRLYGHGLRYAAWRKLTPSHHES
jgi:hypothetical protein